MRTNRLMYLLPDMAVFVAVVEYGSFTAAAKKLGVTPSAVSRKISRLESALSIKLLERTTRKVALNEAGQETYNYCRNMLNSAKEAVAASHSVTTKPLGNLRISVPGAFCTRVLRPLIFTFLEKYPEIKLSVKTTDRWIDPIYDEVDIAFRLTEKPTKGLISKVVGKVDTVLCASPEYLKKNGVPQHPSELEGHQCLYLGETPLDNHWIFERANQKVTVVVDGRFVVNHTIMRLSGIKDGLGIGVLPDFTARKSLKNGSVIRLFEDWTIKGNYQGVITLQFARSKYLPTKCRVFIDHICEQLDWGSS